MIIITNLKKINTLIIPILVAIFNVIIILFPQNVLLASKNGLLLWFNKVIPSLLPFLIGTSLLNSLGFCSFLGVLFSPLMNKLFKISGEGAFAFVVGLSSGYPIGAKTVCELRNNSTLKKNEAQRLLGFSNNSGPLFILGTTATSMLLCPKVGYIMLAIHYLSAIITGIFLTLFNSKKETQNNKLKKASLKNAINALIDFKNNNSKPFGEILSNSIKTSIETISQIGGFIILFSVISEIIALLINNFSTSNCIKGIIVGIIEITNGTAILSANNSPLVIAVITALISWGGLSIHAQSIAIISKTDLSPLLYILSKLFQAIIAFLLSLLSMPIIKKAILTQESFSQENISSLYILKTSSLSFAYIIIFMLISAMLILLLSKIISNKKRYRGC